MNRVYAILLAAGRGSRMQSGTPKQFLEIAGRPMVCWSLQAFEESRTDEVIVVTGQEDLERMREIVDQYGFSKVRAVVAGGRERYDSVCAGVDALTGDDRDVVLIHDSARPMITPEKIDEVITAARQTGACALAVPVKDTIRLADDEKMTAGDLERSRLRAMQTPQAFTLGLCRKAYALLREEGMDRSGITDDVMVMQRMCGIRSMLLEGDERNIKVTTPADLLIAEMYLKERKTDR